jgi:tetratricopeptide (TPR) repeat protein
MIHPRIFISAVTSEFGESRALVAKTLVALGYEPVWQDIFSTEGGTVFQMLEAKIASCQAVVHLVGQRYGAEPRSPHPRFGRVSYTQFEAMHARATRKKVIVIFCDDGCTTACAAPEAPELAELQRAYRESLRANPQLRHHAHTPVELELLVHRLRDELILLRRGLRRWAAVAAVLGLFLVAAATKLLIDQHQMMLVLAQLPEVEAAQRRANQWRPPGEDTSAAAQRAAAYAALERKFGRAAGTLARELPGLAQKILEKDPAISLPRAHAAYALQRYEEAERVALGVAAHSAGPDPAHPPSDETARHAAMAALELAGRAALQRDDPPAALEHFRAAAALTNRTRDPLEWSRAQWSIAFVQLEQGVSGPEIENALRTALEVYRGARQGDDEDTLALSDNLGIALYGQGRYKEAALEWEAMLAAAERIRGALDRLTLRSSEHLAVAWYAQGKYADARAKLRAVIALETAQLGGEDPDTISSRHNLAVVAYAVGEHGEALRESEFALAARERRPGPTDPSTLATRHVRAATLDALGRLAEAEKDYRIILAAPSMLAAPDQPEALSCRSDLANTLGHLGRLAEAERDFRTVIAKLSLSPGRDHPTTLGSRNDFADMLQRVGRVSEAENEHRAIFEARARALGPDHPDTLLSGYGLAGDLAAAGRPQEARPIIERIIAAGRRVLPAGNADVRRFEELGQRLAAVGG